MGGRPGPVALGAFSRLGRGWMAGGTLSRAGVRSLTAFYKILQPQLGEEPWGPGPGGGRGCSAGIWQSRREGEGRVENGGAWGGCGAAGAGLGTGSEAVEAGPMRLPRRGPSGKPRGLLSAGVPEARSLGELCLMWGWPPVTCL